MTIFDPLELYIRDMSDLGVGKYFDIMAVLKTSLIQLYQSYVSTFTTQSKPANDLNGIPDPTQNTIADKYLRTFCQTDQVPTLAYNDELHIVT